jgi:phosphoadenosine phosphosulfate reductase
MGSYVIKNEEELKKKIEKAKEIIKESFNRYPYEDLAVAWTGGKDSTLLLYLIKAVCEEQGVPIPKCFCINEGDLFDEILEFVDEIKEKLNLTFKWIHNEDVSKLAGGKLGAKVKVADLNERNRKEVERLGYDKEEFDYEPESYVGNHLMKTVGLNMYLDDEHIAAFYEGIRWDEQGAREDEKFFSPREGNEFNREHMRVCPILHLTEREVWDAHFYLDVPINILYKQGYRSLGARITTTKLTDVPAWEQDVENTSERGGRRQDKEGLMKRLRQLGYM